MASPQQDVKFLGGTLIHVGLSLNIAVVPGPNMITNSFKVVSGGTLWIAPFKPAALSGSSALVGVGYPMGGSEVMNVGGPASFFLSAGGATVVVGLALGFTGGYSSVP